MLTKTGVCQIDFLLIAFFIILGEFNFGIMVISWVGAITKNYQSR